MKEANIEIERKFLVYALPANFKIFPHKEIVQGYLKISADGTEERLRKMNGKYYKTVKSGSGKIRTENETEITEEEFNNLWSLTEGKRIEKTRYDISDNVGLIELDIYHGKLDGLITVEIEFDSENASNIFVPPAWFGDDITDDINYKNQNLAINGIPKK